MQGVVDDVQEEREKEGSPANSQGYQHSGGCDLMTNSSRISYSDDVFSRDLYQDHHCQTEQRDLNLEINISQYRPNLKTNHDGVVNCLLYEL